MQITLHYTTAYTLNQFLKDYSHYSLLKFKKSVSQTALISMAELIFLEFTSRLEFGWEHILWETASEVLFI